jgi:hypothetical protein
MSTAENEPSSQARADQHIDNDANPLVGSAPQSEDHIKGVSDLSRAFLSDPLETWMEIPR